MYICAELQLGKEGGGGETAPNQIMGNFPGKVEVGCG